MARPLRTVGQSLIDSLLKAYHGWHEFWFQPQNPLALSLMRLFVGGMLFYTHFVWGLEFDAFFSDTDSWQSQEFVLALQKDQWAWSFWWWIPEAWKHTAHFVCLAILAAFWLGFATRITGWAAFLITISYAQRVPLATYGLDQVNGFCALYLAIAPSGARLSIDAWLRRVCEASRHCRGLRFIFPGTAPSTAARLATRLLQLHLCVMYLFAGLGKLQGETWWNGEALWLSAGNLEYQSNDLTWIAHYPWLYQLMSIGTWVWELTFSILIWRPHLRPMMIAAGIGMHLGIGMFMGMWTFGLSTIFVYFAFLNPDWLSIQIANIPLFSHPRGDVLASSTSE